MSLKRYTLTTGGRESTVLLSDDDAERYGEAAVPADGGVGTTKSPEDTKQRAPENKARDAASK